MGLSSRESVKEFISSFNQHQIEMCRDHTILVLKARLAATHPIGDNELVIDKEDLLRFMETAYMTGWNESYLHNVENKSK
jgi:hypothetical protein